MDKLADTSATVGCTVTGITTALTGIAWYDDSNGELTGASYTKDDGTVDVAGEQIAKLTVTGGVATDTTYKCEIENTKHEASINVYSKLFNQVTYFEIMKHSQS